MTIPDLTIPEFKTFFSILNIMQLKKELVETTSQIAALKSELETARAKNKSDSETIKIQQGKIENISAKCSAFKSSTKKCQDEFIEKENEMNVLRYKASV